MKDKVNFHDLANGYIANIKPSNLDVPKNTDQISKLAQEDVSALHTSNELTFVAFQIKDSIEPLDKYERICSSILLLTGTLPCHLIYISQHMDVFSEYYGCYLKCLQMRLHEIGIANIL